jgi:hypothetical protein
MPPRKKKTATPPKAAPPPIDALLAAKAASDPHAWEAMLNLNKMRAARRKLERSDAAATDPATKDRD